MAHLVVLVPADRSDVILGAEALTELSDLGVTTVWLARDDRTVAVVVEGWAFDSTCREAVLHALGVTACDARALSPVARLAVHSTHINEEARHA